jgi:hypothetical protein
MNGFISKEGFKEWLKVMFWKSTPSLENPICQAKLNVENPCSWMCHIDKLMNPNIQIHIERYVKMCVI